MGLTAITEGAQRNTGGFGAQKGEARVVPHVGVLSHCAAAQLCVDPAADPAGSPAQRRMHLVSQAGGMVIHTGLLSS